MKGFLYRIAGLALLLTACQQVELPVEPEHVSGPEFTAQIEAFDAQTKTAGTWNHDKKGAYLRIDSSVTRPGGASWTNEIATSNGITKANVEAHLVIPE